MVELPRALKIALRFSRGKKKSWLGFIDINYFYIGYCAWCCSVDYWFKCDEWF